MDALSFVMGDRVSSLRVKHLKDLIHGAHIGKPVSNTARVAMRYCSDEEEEKVFCRIITGQWTLPSFFLLGVAYARPKITTLKLKLKL